MHTAGRHLSRVSCESTNQASRGTNRRQSKEQVCLWPWKTRDSLQTKSSHTYSRVQKVWAPTFGVPLLQRNPLHIQVSAVLCTSPCGNWGLQNWSQKRTISTVTTTSNKSPLSQTRESHVSWQHPPNCGRQTSQLASRVKKLSLFLVLYKYVLLLPSDMLRLESFYTACNQKSFLMI